VLPAFFMGFCICDRLIRDELGRVVFNISTMQFGELLKSTLCSIYQVEPDYLFAIKSVAEGGIFTNIVLH